VRLIAQIEVLAMKFSRKFLVLAVLALALSFEGLSLAAQEGTGFLEAKVNTGRAGVFVDGKYLGPAANFRMTRKYAVPAGEHEVKLSDPRYEEYSIKVKITAGATTVITQTLAPAPTIKPPFGYLRTQGPDKFAAVFVDGKFMGHVDEFSNVGQRLLLNPGDYTVKIVSPGGGQEYEEKVTIKINATTTVKVK
jgi:hypothetical protein